MTGRPGILHLLACAALCLWVGSRWPTSGPPAKPVKPANARAGSATHPLVPLAPNAIDDQAEETIPAPTDPTAVQQSGADEVASIPGSGIDDPAKVGRPSA